MKLSLCPENVIYVFDGTLPGLYTCVFESVYSKQMPIGITPQKDFEPSLFDVRYIDTDVKRAARVRQSFKEKVSPRALELFENVYYSCLADKEITMLRFLVFAYEHGAKTANMLGEPIVDKMIKAERHLLGENHLLLGFVRFSDYDGALVSVITPKNFVLPYLASHFAHRLSDERFLIFDKTHSAALVYQDKKAQIISLDHLELPEVPPDEGRYRALWKSFYNTVAIEARINPKCRMGHMPKRYWENMVEVKDLL